MLVATPPLATSVCWNRFRCKTRVPLCLVVASTKPRKARLLAGDPGTAWNSPVLWLKGKPSKNRLACFKQLFPFVVVLSLKENMFMQYSVSLGGPILSKNAHQHQPTKAEASDWLLMAPWCRRPSDHVSVNGLWQGE